MSLSATVNELGDGISDAITDTLMLWSDLESTYEYLKSTYEYGEHSKAEIRRWQDKLMELVDKLEVIYYNHLYDYGPIEALDVPIDDLVKESQTTDMDKLEAYQSQIAVELRELHESLCRTTANY